MTRKEALILLLAIALQVTLAVLASAYERKHPDAGWGNPGRRIVPGSPRSS